MRITNKFGKLTLFLILYVKRIQNDV